ncbi:hypothetical protein GQ55_9G387700 [Panicum hallii var. hallii]|uniref:Uncharacterized protein n=1 Tax=Panicum hallii var. hallii TaxID=1504633 RepID=A0A2T7C9H2_9POAL|nr:hypothetical protein GQ55_9G387700 [Panicum hallii var. hallii]
MVKIVDVEEQPDVTSDDDDCVEIDPAEFAKKLNLKETDDVILVAAKGKIVKVEVDQPEGFAKALGKHVAAGDCIDNPYKIGENEMSLLNVEIDVDRFAIIKPSAKLHGDNQKDGQFFRGDKDEIDFDDVNIVPGKLVVKLEPVDSMGVEVVPEKPVVKCGPVGDIALEEGYLTRKMTRTSL